MSVRFLRHRLLEACGVEHGFGLRGTLAPPGVVQPVQVHGRAVAEPTADRNLAPAEADAVVSGVPGLPIAVLTADCVPLLASAADGSVVAAIHAGWRGLAKGVVEAGLARLRTRAAAGQRLVAVVGPRIGSCCYEVDEVVRGPLAERFGEDLQAAWRPGRRGHGWLDLGQLVLLELARAGIGEADRAAMAGVCTRCDPQRFHSYRRDGQAAGRLLHHVSARGPRAGTPV